MSADIKVTDGTILEALNNKVDIDFDNVASNSVSFARMSREVTNCITEIPQRIKLELADGVLTLKAGSEIILSGEEYKTYVTTEDQIFTFSGTESEQRMVFVAAANGAIQSPSPLSDITSGNGTPTDATTGSKYYDYTNRLFYYKKAGGSWANWAVAYPIGIVTITEGVITSIDQVFNGMGYIGSTIWVDKGVKGLISNGRNEDGSLNNKEYTSIFQIYNKTSGNTSHHNVFFLGEVNDRQIFTYCQDRYTFAVQTQTEAEKLMTDYATSSIIVYIAETNRVIAKNSGGTRGVNLYLTNVLSVKFDENYQVTSFEHKQPFKAVDYSELEEVIVVTETYGSGTSGYRIWSDGYCEQWGYYSGSIAANKSVLITLLKSFIDKTYRVFVNPSLSTSTPGSAYYAMGSMVQSVNSFYIINDANPSDMNGVHWEAKGYIL